jgi:hypothetical protein
MDLPSRGGGRGCSCCFPPAMSLGVASRLRSEQGLSRSERRHLPTDQSSRRSEAASVGHLRCDAGFSSSENVQLPVVAREDIGHNWHRSRTFWLGLCPSLECARRHDVCLSSSPHFVGRRNWHLVLRWESKRPGLRACAFRESLASRRPPEIIRALGQDYGNGGGSSPTPTKAWFALVAPFC